MSERLLDQLSRALIVVGAFAWATSGFFSLSWILGFLPPTAAIAVGRVTVDGASKLHDYVTAAIFFTLVPLATVALCLAGERLRSWYLERLRRGRRASDETERALGFAATFLFVLPFVTSPFLYLVSRKSGWPMFGPLVIAPAGPLMILFWRERLWVRQIFDRSMAPFHALALTSFASWIFCRYVATGARIAHFPTLVLEVVIIAFLLGVFHGGLILLSRIAVLLFGGTARDMFARMSVATTPMVFLAPLVLLRIDTRWVATGVVAAVLAGVVMAAQARWQPEPIVVRKSVIWVAIPVLLWCISFASIGAPLWVDLFHRGESLGPASDYLRGKVPYRDVFVLHGLLDDGLLDAWLMELTGRSLEVATLRVVVLTSFLAPFLWMLGIVMFESMGLALLVVCSGVVMAPHNQRAVVMTLVVVALVAAVQRSMRRTLVFLSGALASLALFHSLEMGIYSILGGFFAIGAVALFDRRAAGTASFSMLRCSAVFLMGLVAGAAPFVVWLEAHGALGAFLRESFVTVPSAIDATWSLPFPAIGKEFASDLSVRGIVGFLIGERPRFLLNAVVLALVSIWIIGRYVKRGAHRFVRPAIVILPFALLLQRSALGRADLQHQVFAAFLIPPLLVLLIAEIGAAMMRLQRRGSDGDRAFAWVVTGFGCLVLAVMLWIPDLVASQIDEIAHYRSRRDGGVASDPVSARVFQRVEALREAVARIAKPGQPVFDFSNQPALYFFLDRPNPTRFYQIPILSLPALQKEAIEQLDRTPPKVILRHSPEGYDRFDGIPNEARAAAVAAWIDARYELDRTVQGIEIWTQRESVGHLDPQRFLEAIRPPHEAAIAQHQRLVFPSIASLEGLAGAAWQSDLTIHNPSSTALAIDLRYLGPRVRVVHVVVPARASLRWVDVVRNLFGSRGTRGTLLIDSAVGSSPVATVVTRDVTSLSPPMVIHPLQSSDTAATGGSLVLAGLPAAGQRVNVGVINLGDQPARFRITTTTASGDVVGEPFEATVSELDSYLLVDAGKTLGVPIDEGIAIRIEVIEGTAAGYASLIDPSSRSSQLVVATPVK